MSVFSFKFKEAKAKTTVIENVPNFSADDQHTEEAEEMGRKRTVTCFENAYPTKKSKKEFVIEKLLEEKPDNNAEEADYNQLPIEEFGLAFLKGCGWKEGQAIGKSQAAAPKLPVPTVRPKGLGLGAKITENLNTYLDSKGIRRNKLKVNTMVEVLSGAERGRTGKVMSMDEDNASCFVEITQSGNLVRVNQYNLKVLDDKDSSSKDEKKTSRSDKHKSSRSDRR